MEADSGRGGGDGHGTSHSGSDGVLVLPPMPPLPDSRADLWAHQSSGSGHTPPLAQLSIYSGVVTDSTVGGNMHIITVIALLFVEPVPSSEEEDTFFLV